MNSPNKSKNRQKTSPKLSTMLPRVLLGALGDPRGSQESLRRPKGSAKSPPKQPKEPQGRPRQPQESPNNPHRSLKSSPRDPKKARKHSQTAPKKVSKGILEPTFIKSWKT